MNRQYPRYNPKSSTRRQGDDFATSFMASLENPPTNNVESKAPLKWFVPAMIASIFVIIGIIIAIIAVSSSESYDSEAEGPRDNGASETPSNPDGTIEDDVDEEFYNNAYDEISDNETLNEELALAVLENRYKDYRSEAIEETIYAKIAPKNLCVVLDVARTSLANPAADSKFEQTTAMNSNSLDYYLDSDNIVIMFVTYDSSVNPTPLVVYARADSFYLAFYANDMSGVIYLTRSQLFDEIVGVPEFYIMKGIS